MFPINILTGKRLDSYLSDYLAKVFAPFLWILLFFAEGTMNMTLAQKPTSLSQLAHQYDVFIFDLSGTLYEGKIDLSVSQKTLQELKKQNKKIVFLSNMPRPGQLAHDRLVSKGFDLNGIITLTSGDHFLESWRSLRNVDGTTPTFFQIGADKNTDLLKEQADMPMADLNTADFIILTAFCDIHETEYYEKTIDQLRKAFERKLTVLCTNPDMTVAMPKDRKTAGHFAKIYEDWGGKVIYYGKPHLHTYEWLFAKLAHQGFTDKSRMLMIGDNLNTDIYGGINAGIHTLLVLTGLSTETDIQTAKITPTYMLPSVQWDPLK